MGELNGVFGVRVEPQYDRIVIDHTERGWQAVRELLFPDWKNWAMSPSKKKTYKIEPNENNFCGCTVGPSSDGLRRFRSEERRK
ncbi:MAG: hypothetical protein ACLTZY_00835 [Alistipes indistinctus]